MSQTVIKSLDGQEFNAYLALPEGGSAPALILIHEIFGVNAAMRALCDSFAQKGYIAICPDLFWRLSPGFTAEDNAPEEWSRAFDLYKQFDVEASLRDLLATLAFARRSHGSVGRVASLGFGLGGKLSFLMGSRSDVECSVAYYGVGLDSLIDEIPDVRMPMLLHIAEKDKFASVQTRDRMIKAASRNPVIRTELYAGTEHAFARPTAPTFDAGAAKTASEKTDAFLAEFLRDKT